MVAAMVATGSSFLPLSCISSGRSSRKSRKWLTLVYVKRVSGFEEALRIQREHELRSSQKFAKVGPLRRGKVSRQLEVPDTIPVPRYIASEALPELEPAPQIHDSDGIACIRACELSACALDHACILTIYRAY